jgi:transcriptional regulator with XRE-family HTH domain
VGLGIVNSKRPSKIDKLIGRRIRERREHLGLTQEDLADRADVTHQQFRKYEAGENRISAGRLYEIARTLKTSVAHFYPGDEGAGLAPARGVAEEPAEFEIPRDDDAADLVRAFRSLSAAKRQSILAMVRKEAEAGARRKPRRT